jgi:hypothetical protein
MQQPFNAIQAAVGVSFVETSLVSPAVTVFSQFTDQAAFNKGKVVPEDVVPVIPHEYQDNVRIPVGWIR